MPNIPGSNKIIRDALKEIKGKVTTEMRRLKSLSKEEINHGDLERSIKQISASFDSIINSLR